MTNITALIGLTGFKRSGKNAVGDILADLLPGPVEMVSFAEPLKKYTYDHNQMVDYNERHDRPVYLQEVVDDLGWEKAKDIYPEVRRALQNMGTDVFRNNVSATYWVDKAREQMHQAREQGAHAIVTDVRFKNEAQIIQDQGGFVFRIDRPSVEPDMTQPLHASETELLTIPVNGIIDNSGSLEELRHAVKSALHKVAFGG